MDNHEYIYSDEKFTLKFWQLGKSMNQKENFSYSDLKREREKKCNPVWTVKHGLH